VKTDDGAWLSSVAPGEGCDQAFASQSHLCPGGGHSKREVIRRREQDRVAVDMTGGVGAGQQGNPQCSTRFGRNGFGVHGGDADRSRHCGTRRHAQGGAYGFCLAQAEPVTGPGPDQISCSSV